MRSLFAGCAIAVLWVCSSSADCLYGSAAYSPYYYHYAHRHIHARAHYRADESHAATYESCQCEFGGTEAGCAPRVSCHSQGGRCKASCPSQSSD